MPLGFVGIIYNRSVGTCIGKVLLRYAKIRRRKGKKKKDVVMMIYYYYLFY